MKIQTIKNSPGKMNYYERYINHTDAQILEILKNHKDYQETAVDAAVKIAVERKLIQSEQDLMAPEFQGSKSIGLSFFPEISSDFKRERLIGSVFRFFYVMSFLPVVYGVLKYAEGQLNQTYLGVSIGLIWLLLIILLNKTRKLVLMVILFVLLGTVSIAIGQEIFNRESFILMDMIMLLIGTILPAYLLLLLKHLIQQKSENS